MGLDQGFCDLVWFCGLQCGDVGPLQIFQLNFSCGVLLICPSPAFLFSPCNLLHIHMWVGIQHLEWPYLSNTQGHRPAATSRSLPEQVYHHQSFTINKTLKMAARIDLKTWVYFNFAFTNSLLDCTFEKMTNLQIQTPWSSGSNKDGIWKICIWHNAV